MRKFLTINFLLVIFLGSGTIEVMAQEGSQMIISFENADSLYFAKDWKNAKIIYSKLLTDTSKDAIHLNRAGFVYYSLRDNNIARQYYQRALRQNPIPAVKASVLSRIARVDAVESNAQKAIEELNNAGEAGYNNLSEVDSLSDFNSLRSTPEFKQLRQKIYAAAFPCMVDSHAREFDFWIGEWDVYVTGTKIYAGHSLIQMIAGGCALLENWDSPSSTGKSINFIDPVTNKWKQSWAGSYAGGIQEFENGEYKDSAMCFQFESKDAASHKIIGRFIFYNEKPGQVRQFNETSSDEGKTWVTNYDFTYLKKN